MPASFSRRVFTTNNTPQLCLLGRTSFIGDIAPQRANGEPAAMSLQCRCSNSTQQPHEDLRTSLSPTSACKHTRTSKTQSAAMLRDLNPSPRHFRAAGSGLVQRDTKPRSGGPRFSRRSASRRHRATGQTGRAVRAAGMCNCLTRAGCARARQSALRCRRCCTRSMWRRRRSCVCPCVSVSVVLGDDCFHPVIRYQYLITG